MIFTVITVKATPATASSCDEKRLSTLTKAKSLYDKWGKDKPVPYCTGIVIGLRQSVTHNPGKGIGSPHGIHAIVWTVVFFPRLVGTRVSRKNGSDPRLGSPDSRSARTVGM